MSAPSLPNRAESKKSILLPPCQDETCVRFILGHGLEDVLEKHLSQNKRSFVRQLSVIIPYCRIVDLAGRAVQAVVHRPAGSSSWGYTIESHARKVSNGCSTCL